MTISFRFFHDDKREEIVQEPEYLSALSPIAKKSLRVNNVLPNNEWTDTSSHEHEERIGRNRANSKVENSESRTQNLEGFPLFSSSSFSTFEHASYNLSRSRLPSPHFSLSRQQQPAKPKLRLRPSSTALLLTWQLGVWLTKIPLRSRFSDKELPSQPTKVSQFSVLSGGQIQAARTTAGSRKQASVRPFEGKEGDSFKA